MTYTLESHALRYTDQPIRLELRRNTGNGEYEIVEEGQPLRGFKTLKSAQAFISRRCRIHRTQGR